MAAGALAPDLDSGGIAAWVRGRPVVVGVAAIVVLLLSVVLGVGLGSVPIGPTDTVGVILWRTFGVRVGLDWAPASEAIIWDLRLPRVLTAMVIGLGSGRRRRHVPGAAS